MSEIFNVEDGYVVVMLSDINDATHQSFDEVKSTIERELRNKRSSRLSPQDSVAQPSRHSRHR